MDHFKDNKGLSILEIVDKISISCHKHGLRVGDFFKDYDKLRSGIITDSQFASGLTIVIKGAASLNEDDISQLTGWKI